MSAWAETYFDHYEKILGKARRRDVFEIENTGKKIQILAYKNVFPRTVTFCSIGLSSFESVVGLPAELIVVVDEGWEYIPAILAQAISFIVTKPMKMGWGFVVDGDSKINLDYYDKFGKEALYFTHPMGFPNEFYTVVKSGSNSSGEVYMGIPISKEELQMFKKMGADKFESKMQESGVDPFEISRKSVV